VTLQPRRPPGHAKRKALAYAGDVLRLRCAGHTYSAIREALQDAGVLVSLSTVRREVLRGGPPPVLCPTPSMPPAGAAEGDGPGRPERLAALPPSSAPLRGRAVAEEFMRDRPTSPLVIKEPIK
jgi:hypothetical protein